MKPISGILRNLGVYLGLLLLVACGSTTTGPEVPDSQAPGSTGAVSAIAQCAPTVALKLSWTAVAGAESYTIERDYLTIATLGDGGASEYLDATVEIGGTYTYRLIASNEQGQTSSIPVTASVPFDVCRSVSTMIASLDDTSMLISEDGRFWTWGANHDGLLGVGSYDELLEPVELPGVSNVVTAAYGLYHVLLLDSTGQVWSWGENSYGQIGLGRGGYGPLVPNRIADMPDITGVAAGRYHSLAVAADGSLWTWGRNDHGQLGLGAGIDNAFDPVQVSGMTDVVAVFAGGSSSFALHADGTLSAWGHNNHGQLGLGDTTDRDTPELIPSLPEVAEVAVGLEFTFVRQQDGTVLGFGDGGYLGASLSGDQPVPLPIVDLAGAASLAAGEGHALAVLADGSVVAWGDNSWNQVGASVAPFVDLPTPVPGLEDVVAVAAGRRHSLAVTGDGGTWAWGSNRDNQLGWNGPLAYFEFIEIDLPAEVVQFSSQGHTLALLADGTVWAWGDGEFGKLGSGTSLDAYVAAQVNFPPGVVIEEVAAGHAFSLARDSSGAIWSWGDGTFGSLGHGDNLSLVEPQQITSVPTVFTSISAGRQHALALDASGNVWAWGVNDSGQLGLGHTIAVNTPTVVGALANVSSIAAGWQHSAVVLDSGEVWSFGSRNYGALGDGGATTGYSAVPVMTQILDVADVSAGTNYTIALGTDGTLSSWGNNDYGRLGLGNSLDEHLPVGIADLPEMASIDAGYFTALAVAADGSVYGWGQADEGQLGLEYVNEANSPRLLPVPAATGPISVAAGYDFSLALVDGTLLGSGTDEYGELGQGRLGRSAEPVLIEGLPRAAVP